MTPSSAHKSGRVLVVGTTPDYIHLILSAHPGRALFLTDPGLRAGAQEPAPACEEEILVDLSRKKNALQALCLHLERHGQHVTGIACFDCESLELAAVIAAELGIDYSSVETVRNCRDKFMSKEIWRNNGIPCPKTAKINCAQDAVSFLQKCENGIVLKPFYGSGSELVFRCRTDKECATFFQVIQEGLSDRMSNPIFKKQSSQGHLMLAEEFVVGTEYSCDMIVDGDAISIIRTARKIKPSGQPFGTVSGYILPASLPTYIDPDEFENMLLKSAQVLGIRRGICMVDFILHNHLPKLIEMTPRPGGDCLPSLLKAAGNIDILSLCLDFSEHKPYPINGGSPMSTHIGLRIHASKAGRLKGFNTESLMGDERIKQIHFTRTPGHMIKMPPADYDSWLLGHVIIKPDQNSYPETQSFLIGKRLKVEIE